MEIHIIHNGEQRGPYSIAEINWDLARAALPADTLAWHAGLTDWTPIRNISGIKPLQNQSAIVTGVVPHQPIRSARHNASTKESNSTPTELCKPWSKGLMLVGWVVVWVGVCFLTVYIAIYTQDLKTKADSEKNIAEEATLKLEREAWLVEAELENAQRTDIWRDREIISVEEISGGMETKTETQTRTVSRPFVVKSGKKFGIGLMPINEDVEKPKTTYRRTQYRVTYFSENSETKQIVTLDYNPLRYQ